MSLGGIVIPQEEIPAANKTYIHYYGNYNFHTPSSEKYIYFLCFLSSVKTKSRGQHERLHILIRMNGQEESDSTFKLNVFQFGRYVV